VFTSSYELSLYLSVGGLLLSSSEVCPRSFSSKLASPWLNNINSDEPGSRVPRSCRFTFKIDS